MTSWNVSMKIAEERPWHMIADFNQLLKAWKKGLKTDKFMYIRYAGKDYYVNPHQITLIQGRP